MMAEGALRPVAEAQGITKWDRFLYWANQFLTNDPRFEDEERNYKLPVAERLGEARELLLAGDGNWRDCLHSAIHHRNNNLTNWRTMQPLEQWFRDDRPTAELAFRSLWDADRAIPERFNEFVRVATHAGLKAPISEVSFLHMAIDPSAYPMYRATPVERAMDLTGFPVPKEVGIPSADTGRRYQHLLQFLDLVIKRGAERGIPFRDRLDAQSATWCVTQWGPPGNWSPEAQRVFLAFRGESKLYKDSWDS